MSDVRTRVWNYKKSSPVCKEWLHLLNSCGWKTTTGVLHGNKLKGGFFLAETFQCFGWWGAPSPDRTQIPLYLQLRRTGKAHPLSFLLSIPFYLLTCGAQEQAKLNSFPCFQKLQTDPPPAKAHIQFCFCEVSLFRQRRHKHRLSYSLRRIRNKKRESAKVCFFIRIWMITSY